MTRAVLAAAALAASVSLAWAGGGYAQAQSQSPAPPAAAPADPGSAPTQPPTSQPNLSTPDSNQQSYSPRPPSDDSSGVYLPAAVGGYLRSSASCLVIGCDDGPEVKVAPNTPPGGAPNSPRAEPPSSAGAAGALH